MHKQDLRLHALHLRLCSSFHHKVTNSLFLTHPSLQLTFHVTNTGQPPLQSQHLASTQDLLSRFHLLPAYDKYVRPFATQYSDDGQIRSTPAPDNNKGKAKQLDSTQPRTPAAPALDAPDHDDDDTAGGGGGGGGLAGGGGGAKGGERKKKNTYKSLIKGIPGASISFSHIHLLLMNLFFNF